MKIIQMMHAFILCISLLGTLYGTEAKVSQKILDEVLCAVQETARRNEFCTEYRVLNAYDALVPESNGVFDFTKMVLCYLENEVESNKRIGFVRAACVIELLSTESALDALDDESFLEYKEIVLEFFGEESSLHERVLSFEKEHVWTSNDDDSSR